VRQIVSSEGRRQRWGRGEPAGPPVTASNVTYVKVGCRFPPPPRSRCAGGRIKIVNAPQKSQTRLTCPRGLPPARACSIPIPIPHLPPPPPLLPRSCRSRPTDDGSRGIPCLIVPPHHLPRHNVRMANVGGRAGGAFVRNASDTLEARSRRPRLQRASAFRAEN